MAEPVQLVFFGEVLEGFSTADVKQSLGQLFKLDEARLAQMFSGARVVINRAVEADAAAQHVARFARVGARVRVESPMLAPAALAPVAAPAAVPPPPAAPAEEEIVCPNCGERQSKRLLCRACSTNMPMGIAAKLEAEQQARAEAQAQRDARRGGVASGGRVAPQGVGTGLWGFGFEGRVGRLAYGAAGSLLLVVMLGLLVFLLKRPGAGRLALFGLGMLAVVFVSVRLSVLRCHDCNRSGWWSVLVVVPYVSVVAGLLLSFLPGTADANDYGEPPARGSWVLLLGSLALLAASMVWVSSSLWDLAFNRRAEEVMPVQEGEANGGAAGLLSADARRAYDAEYAGAPNHKAFAVSPGGAWGWKSGEPTAGDAVAAALATCSANRQSYTPPCLPVNVDGQWLETPP